MSKNTKQVDFAGQEIYVGMDVHWKQWTICIATAATQFRPFASPPTAANLTAYLRQNFPGGNYHCAYEAGFCGYVPQEELSALGIHCIVIHPADIPTTNREAEFKYDPHDALKICRALRSGLLRCIHIPGKEQQIHRSLVRQRNQLRQDITRQRNRIKGLLKFYGIHIPTELDKPKWTATLIAWLWDLTLMDECGTETFRTAMGQLAYLTGIRDYTNRRLTELSNTDRYLEAADLLSTVPGIGRHTAIKFLIEAGDLGRFRSLDQLCNYVGLVPASHSSGDTLHQNRITYRGHKELRTMLVEAAWAATAIDPALTRCYEALKSRMLPSKAIIRIARKLLARMRYVLQHKEPYQHGIAA
jgi:transposase